MSGFTVKSFVRYLLPQLPTKRSIKLTRFFFLGVCISFCVSSCINNAMAYEKDFPPYPKNKFPPACKIHPLKATSETDRNKGNFKSTYQLTDQKKDLNLKLTMNYQKGVSGMYLSLKDTKGKEYIKPLKIGWHPTNIDRVYWAYLNKDNHKDLIVNMDTGDGYLSGGRQQTTFLLSTKQGYVAKQLGVYHLEQQDFYDYSTDNKCEFLHQALVSTGKQEYWIYNVLQFIDGRIIIKNQLSRYFPKWIALTLTANDKSATLNAEQKEVLQKAYLNQMKKGLD